MLSLTILTTYFKTYTYFKVRNFPFIYENMNDIDIDIVDSFEKAKSQ